jgi:hypothetical protein
MSQTLKESQVMHAPLNEQYVRDRTGNPIGVFLSLEDFRRIVDELEELDAIRAYDAATASGDEEVPFEASRGGN